MLLRASQLPGCSGGRTPMAARSHNQVRDRRVAPAHDHQAPVQNCDLVPAVCPPSIAVRRRRGLNHGDDARVIARGEVGVPSPAMAPWVRHQATASRRGGLSATMGFDLPLVQHDTGLQLDPDWRVHGGAVWAF